MRVRRFFVGLCLSGCVALPWVPGGAEAASGAATSGTTQRVSLSSAEVQGNAESGGVGPAISADGRFIAFATSASNLVGSDTNAGWDVFVRDRQTGATARVSISSAGRQGNGSSEHPAISGDGRFVVFDSAASNLVPGDTNGAWDVFVRDRENGITRRVSVSSAGAQGNGDSGGFISYGGPAISANGRFVAFWSEATNLVGGDTNASPDLFMRDLKTGTTQRIDVSSAGAQSRTSSPYARPSISADGRFVAFDSTATNLVTGDTNGRSDVFVRDRWKHTTWRVSVSSAGAQANGDSSWASISANGGLVAFDSTASNLIVRDTNGTSDVFVRDLTTGTTRRVSVSSAGAQGHDETAGPSVSADGRFVAFWSLASNLVAGDTNLVNDVFVRDRRNATTRRVSVSSAGAQGNDESIAPAISAAGGFVAYTSWASNLVPGDTNGVADVFVRGPLR
jgi:Tol biopolymer transport system component